jgi:hypothetical protein
MLAKILLDLSIWFMLSLIVGLLVGRAICAFQKPPAPGSIPSLEVHWEPVRPTEWHQEEMDARPTEF